MRLLIVAVLLVFILLHVTAEDHENNAQSRIDTFLKPPDKTVLQKSIPYPKEEKSFMSKLTSWIFPFGNTDNVPDSLPEETHPRSPTYLPPPQKLKTKEENCNPCNREPWIPVAANYGKNTVIGFMQQSHLNLQPPSLYGPPPSTNYGAPQTGRPNAQNYQHFTPPSSQYGPPPSTNYGAPQTGRPNVQNYQHLSPSSSQHGPPTLNNPHTFSNHQNFNNQQNFNNPQSFNSLHTPRDYFTPPPYPKYVPPKTTGKYTPPNKYRPPKLFFPLIDQQRPPPMAPPLSYGPPPSLHSNFKLSQPSTINSQYIPPLVPSVNYRPPPPPPSSSSSHLPILYERPPNPQAGYFPPQQQIPLESNNVPRYPIPLPNLSSGPIAPLHHYQDFHNGQQASDIQIVQSVPVADFLSSIEHPVKVFQSPLLDVTVKEEVKEDESDSSGYGESNLKLSENPIVVEDTHTSASIKNATYEDSNVNKRGNEKAVALASSNHQQTNDGLDPSVLKNLLEEQGVDVSSAQLFDVHSENQSKFTQPPMDFSNWTPSVQLSTSMLPPPVGISPWLSVIGNNVPESQKKTKQIQIIIPYVTGAPGHKPNLLSPFTQPPSILDPVWSQYSNEQSSKEVEDNFEQTTNSFSSPEGQASSFSQSSVKQPNKIETNPIYSHASGFSSIRDLLKGEVDTNPVSSNNMLPFDIITLQKHIDDWTQQEFSNKINLNDFDKLSTSAKLVPSKKIPDEYLTTAALNEATTIKSVNSEEIYDHYPAGSSNKESKVINDDFETNFILSETTPVITTPNIVTAKPSLPSAFVQNTDKPDWDKTQVSISPLTKEKVYVVTPQPVIENGSKAAWNFLSDKEKERIAFASSNLAVHVSDIGKYETDIGNETLKIVYSEWPHLINNLQTTTSTTTTAKPSRHPLFGLMDFPSNTPSPNGTVQTYSGHSKVITIVTPASSPKKKSSGMEDKKTASASNSEELFVRK